MTERTWRDSKNLADHLTYLCTKRGLGDRKVQLLCCAFCRRQERHISAAGIRHLLTRMESFADREVTRDELRETLHHTQSRSNVGQNGYDQDNPASTIHYSVLQFAKWLLLNPEAPDNWDHEDDLPDDWFEEPRIPYPLRIAQMISDAIDSDVEIEDKWSYERDQQLLLLRDIFGNPFRPVEIDPRWLTSTVADLSRFIYEERAFDKMPILADALTDAGCDSEEMLNHCRADGPHVRGCWVVDLLLGKT